MILAFYAAKIEATRRSLPVRAVIAVVGAIRDKKRAALRAFTDRRQAALQSQPEERTNERYAEGAVQQNARTPPVVRQ
jgi:hypothetical protein